MRLLTSVTDHGLKRPKLESNYLVIYLIVQRHSLNLPFFFPPPILPVLQAQGDRIPRLLVVSKEHLHGQPAVTTHLEALLDAVQCLDVFARQLPAIELEVGLDARLGHTLGQNAEALGQAPSQQHLLWRLALGLCDGEQCLVLGERGVGAAERRVGRWVNVLGGEVGDELGGRVAWVQLDLVDSGNNLWRAVSLCNLQDEGSR